MRKLNCLDSPPLSAVITTPRTVRTLQLAIFAPIAFLAIGLLGSSAWSKEIQSGPRPGMSLGPFDVIKCAGGKDDGVEVGEQVCYRSKYSGRTQVIVFSRAPEQIGELAKLFETKLEKGDDLRALINLLGDNLEATQKLAREWGERSGCKRSVVVVPLDHQQGPEQYQLNADATTTIVTIRRNRVVSSHAFGADVDAKALMDAMQQELNKL
jgi:hypothetical protein